MPTLEFTVDLRSVMKHAAELLCAIDKGGAGVGVINGFDVATHHLKQIAQRAEELKDPIILFRLYAIGVIENPADYCQELGLWTEDIESLAKRVGAL